MIIYMHLNDVLLHIYYANLLHNLNYGLFNLNSTNKNTKFFYY
jgi:hypothetical protein